MISMNSSIYRQSLWSFSTGRGEAKDKAFVRVLLDRDREIMLCRLKE